MLARNRLQDTDDEDDGRGWMDVEKIPQSFRTTEIEAKIGPRQLIPVQAGGSVEHAVLLVFSVHGRDVSE